MTVCIAARAETDGGLPKVVFCADRMISTSSLQFEHGEAKIQWLTASSLVMISSNNASTSDMIVKNVRLKVAGRPLTTEEAVHLLSQECKALRKKRIEEDILAPLGFTYETFWERSGGLSRDMVSYVMNQLSNYDYPFSTHFIVFGIDQQTSPAYESHIYIVDEDGNFALQDFVGFAAVGSGSKLAFPELTRYFWNRNLSWSEALVRIYNAKKAAERVGGVGKFTDMSVLHVFEGADKVKRVGLWNVSDEVRKLLDEGIETTIRKEGETYVDILQKIATIFAKPQTVQESQTASASGSASGSASASASTGVSAQKSGAGTNQT